MGRSVDAVKALQRRGLRHLKQHLATGDSAQPHGHRDSSAASWSPPSLFPSARMASAAATPQWRGVIRASSCPVYACVHTDHATPPEATACAHTALTAIRASDRHAAGRLDPQPARHPHPTAISPRCQRERYCCRCAGHEHRPTARHTHRVRAVR